MKNLSWVFVFFFSLNAWGAGGMDGGGGQGVLCQTGDKKTLELLDLYEAKNIWGIPLPDSLGSQEDEIRRIERNYRLYNDFAGRAVPLSEPLPYPGMELSDIIRRLTTEFEKKLRPIPLGSRLELSEDMGKPILRLPVRCRYVQIIFYVDENLEDGQVLVDPELWGMLSPQGKVALAFHEETYKMLRAFGEKNSLRTRKVTGLLFDPRGFPGRMRSVYGQSDPIACEVRSPGPDIIRFLLVRNNSRDYGPEDSVNVVMRSVHLSDYSRFSSVLVDSIGETFFRFDDAKKGEFYLPPGVEFQDFWIRSALGTTMARFSRSPGPSCPTGRDCPMKFEILKDSGKWMGGEFSCQPLTDEN